MLNGCNGGLAFYVRLGEVLKSIVGGGYFLQRRPGEGGAGLLRDEFELWKLSWVHQWSRHKQPTRAPRFGDIPKLRNSFLVKLKD